MQIVIDTYNVSLALGFYVYIVAFAGGVRLLGTGYSPLRLAFGKCFSQVVVIPGMKAAHVLDVYKRQAYEPANRMADKKTEIFFRFIFINYLLYVF